MNIAKLIGKLLLCCVVFIVATIVSGIVGGALGLPQMHAPAGTSEQGLFLAFVLASPVLIVGIAPIASGLGKGLAARSAAIFLILYVVFVVNMIEASKFSNMVTVPLWVMFVHYIIPCVLTAITAAWCFGSKEEPVGLARFSPAGWAWRVALAWIAFPMIYFFFGACIAPIVVSYYNAGVAGLRIPPVSVILATQMLRSPMLLVASLPLVALWTRSRRALFISLGIAHACLVGLNGLAQATFFPMVLRVTHSIEITFDSFAYAGVLVLLFAAQAAGREKAPECAKAAVAINS
jgi:hypothetical protein